VEEVNGVGFLALFIACVVIYFYATADVRK
jgi:hypothetical protein